MFTFKHLASVLLVTALIFASGCGGGQCHVSGKVAVQDGTPATTGEVHFTNERSTFRGQIGSNGTYVMMESSGRKGIPPGTYRVSLTGVNVRGEDVQTGFTMIPAWVSLIHSKYGGPSTSGLTCDVKGRTTTYDIECEPAEPRPVR
jgi:hypothetical protein